MLCGNMTWHIQQGSDAPYARMSGLGMKNSMLVMPDLIVSDTPAP